MSNPNRSIAQGATILVTGASGFIASHIVDNLLADGYKIVGTTRSEKPWLEEFFEKRHGKDKFRSVIIPSLRDSSIWDQYMKDVEGIIHAASDLSYNPNAQEVIPDMIAINLSILEAAARSSSVKRVVYTSSATAAFPHMLNPADNREMIVNTDTWNDESVRQAWDAETPLEVKGGAVYVASKVEAERAAWKWVEDHKPNFVFNSVLPNMNFGEMLIPEKQMSSMGVTRFLMAGNDLAIKMIPPQWYIDVKDDARLHAIALLDPEVSSERVFACAAPFTWTEVLQVLRSLRPKNDTLPSPPEGEGKVLIKVLPSQRAEQLLQKFYGRKGWTSLEDTLAAGISGLE
ncbi:hypothetical protein F5884DRAFT_830951 [Xylogone sp. PMI_703]|nr:hypothetical protein F5884DRAFT_830951 [Xylogone sp. PMI_703]